MGVAFGVVTWSLNMALNLGETLCLPIAYPVRFQPKGPSKKVRAHIERTR